MKLEAHAGNPPEWFLDSDYYDWENDSIVALVDCGEIYNLRCTFRYSEETKSHSIEEWYAERFINRFCKDKTSYWHMQIDCDSTDEFTKFYPSQNELIKDIENDKIVWRNYEPDEDYDYEE